MTQGPFPPGFDPGVFSHVFAPTIGFVVVLLVAGAVVRGIIRPIGEAIERIRRSSSTSLTDDVGRQLADVLDEVRQLRSELNELTERMDFAERLLAKSRES
jgi:methyl-accepting chemotaxis protein